MEINGRLHIVQSDVEIIPDENFSNIYPKTDNHWYIKNSDNVEYRLATIDTQIKNLTLTIPVSLLKHVHVSSVDQICNYIMLPFDMILHTYRSTIVPHPIPVGWHHPEPTIIDDFQVLFDGVLGIYQTDYFLLGDKDCSPALAYNKGSGIGYTDMFMGVRKEYRHYDIIGDF